jgi:putative membrane protein insertion efficiency factor
MSALRRRLKDPRLWLALYFALIAGCVADTFRAPGSQLTGKAYVGLVRVYQAVGRPAVRKCVCCRYHPTCSDYSIEAVQTHGIRRGLVLTFRRINSCQPDVPQGTEDPVAPADSP